MGLHLKLLPIDYETDNILLSYTIFHCDKDYSLFEQLQQIEETSTITNLHGFYEDGEEYRHGLISKDGYGEQLVFAFAKEIVKCRPHAEAKINKAIWAYLMHLAPETKVALYWH